AGLCLTTQTGCFVYSFDTISSNSEPMILAFPIDRSSLPLTASPPSICHVDEETFAVAGCMPDMALFVDGSGSAARPPLVWSNEHPKEIVKTDNSLIVVGEKTLVIFDNSPTGRMRQEMNLPSHPCASTILSDSLVIFTRSSDADVFCVRELSWAEKAHELLSNGQLANALYVVTNNAIRSDEDAITYQHVHMHLGFNQIASGEKEEGIELLVKGHVTPSEVENRFKAIFSVEDSKDDSYSDVVLVEKLISRVIDEDWAADQSSDWATLLTIVRLRLCENSIDILEILECDEDYDKSTVQSYCEGRKMFNCLLVLHSLTKSVQYALGLTWLGNDPLFCAKIDHKLLVKLLPRLPLSESQLICETSKFFIERGEAMEELIDFVKTRIDYLPLKFVMNLFKGRIDELEVLLKLNCDQTECAIEMEKRIVELSTIRIASNDITPDESAKLRKKLISIILSGKIQEIRQFLVGDQLNVERTVAEHWKHPESAIQAVIENVECEGAMQAIQQIIHHFSSSHSNLSTHFLLQLKRKCESDPILASSHRLPEVMKTLLEAFPSLISEGAIQFIPENSQLDSFAPLIFREMQSVHDRTVSNRIGRALAERAARTNKAPAPRNSVRVIESTRCGVCSDRFDSASSIHLLPSGKLVHPRCHPHLNICPITNQIFRG
ncbi:hypothetical protein PFISCL1PPCAC_26331, partial [Pristionchus fissidentatus]